MTVPALKCSVLSVRSGLPNAPLVVLGPSLGTTSEIWDTVALALAENHRVLRFDLPGHGFSPPATRSFTVSELAVAVLEVVDTVGGGSFYYSGDSLGGAIGLTLAAAHPERVRALVTFCAGATFGTPDGWRERAAQVRASGTASVVATSAQRWFAPGYLDRDPAGGAAALNRLLEVDDESYALCCDALAEYDLRELAGSISTPTVCAAGEFDIAAPPADIEALADLIPHSRYELVSGAGHLPVLETPAAAEALVRSMLPAPDAFENGMIVRRAVLGNTHVDAANEKLTAETADFQEFLTRYAWGEVWSRPGLSRRDRSLITLASLLTGGHENEFGMHVRAALTNGVTRAEISEVILHCALYAGLPAANTASAIAREVFAGLDEPKE